MDILKKIEKSVLNILTIIVIIGIIIVSYSYVQMQMFNKKYASLFGYTILEISTGSMADTLNIYDVIVVKITKDVKIDDIITFEQNSELVTHRVIEIDGDTIITKGDANNAIDKSIEVDDVVGKVVLTWPKFGIWLKVFAEPKVFVSILITLVLMSKVFSKENK